MKALTLTQPWATLIALGAKTIETRSWATTYRGPLAIHAATGYGKGGMKAHKALCGEEPFCSVLNAACKAHYDALDKSIGVLRAMAEHPFMPLGAIVATCELVTIAEIMSDCLWTTRGGKLIKGGRMPLPDEPGRSFGDYTPFGRYAWILTNVHPLPEPIPAKGALGLWDWEATA